MNLRDLPDMSAALAEVRALEEKKKLDTVDHKELKGSHSEREDKDIDNDGDVDSSDEYLHNRRKAVKKAIAKEEFDIVGWAEDAILELSEEEAIDDLTDEELVDIFETALLELAEGPEELEEMATILEGFEVLSERMDPKEIQRRRDQAKDRLATGAAMKKAAEKSSEAKPSRGERLKAAAKAAGSKAKAGLKAGAKGAAKGAGYAAGLAQRAGSAAKREFSAGHKRGKEGSGGGSSSSSSSDSDDRPAPRSSGGGGGTDTSRGATRRAAGGALRAIGRLAKTAVKKGVGKTARLVSRGSNALAKRLGEDYEHIDHLLESGLFEMTEIESIILEGDPRDEASMKKFQALQKNVDQKKKLNIRGNDSAEQKARLEKKRGMKLDDHPQFKKEDVEVVDEGMKGALKGAATGAAIGTIVPVVGTGLGAAVGAAQGLLRNDRKDKAAKIAAKKARRRTEEVDHEEVELFAELLIGEGADLSEFTWEDMHEEYEMMDEGLRSAVKKLLGGKKKEEKKPESRGEQLRKKYNVGPERSDTSAKRQILDRTRAKAERDEKEYGGSHYSKSVAKKSKDAHDRYLKAGYSKYGADDRRGSGNKARKRAAALTKEEMVMEGILKRAAEKAKSEYGKYKKFGKASGEAVDRLQRMNQHKQDKYGPSTFKQRMKTGAEHNTDNEKKAKEGK